MGRCFADAEEEIRGHGNAEPFRKAARQFLCLVKTAGAAAGGVDRDRNEQIRGEPLYLRAQTLCDGAPVKIQMYRGYPDPISSWI